MKIIAIANQKGGCAKTTTAINLAASLAQMNQRTLLIDLDPQAHATSGLGINPEVLEYSMYNVLSHRSDQRQFLENVIHPYGEGLDIAPGNVLLSTIEQEFVDKNQAVGRLKKAISHLVFPYQYVVIDCPPNLGFLTFNALYASELTVIPVELGSFALYGVAKLLSMIELIRIKMRYAPRVVALATMVDLRSKFSKQMLDQIQDMFKENMFSTIIRTNVACRESQKLGIPVYFHNKRSKSAQDYMSLSREVMGFEEENMSTAKLALSASESRQGLCQFFIDAPKANQVHIVGDFNHWRLDESSQLSGSKGSWSKKINLGPGRYRYKFVVDGKWIVDPNNKLAEPNSYGGVDSIVEVQ